MFGEQVRAQRRRLGLSQEQLAVKAGIDVKTLRNIETGRRVPRVSTVQQLATAFGLDEDERRQFCAGVTPESARRAAPVPAQLPLDVRGFTGRTTQLDALDRIRATGSREPTTVVISAVWGTAGVGKTALAVHWAHRVRHAFGDGQLYLNLRGFDPTGIHVSASEAIRRFLDALGVPPHRIPADADAQAALYRTTLAGRRMLIVLDNARDSDQVRHLLPGAPGCMVLITSRNQLTSLVAAVGAHPVPLDLLSADEARDLFARRVGADRAGAEPDAAEEIVARCARLPLALTIAAARAVTEPELLLGDLAADLRKAGQLDGLALGDATSDLRSVLSSSYRALSADAARLFRLLGLHPGPDVSGRATASLIGLPLPQVRPLLRELTQAHLVIEQAADRYTFHDLLRAYATEQAATVEPYRLRRVALHRLLDHYLHTAHAGALQINPYRPHITVAPPVAGVTPETLADRNQAMTWFTTEHRVLLAVVQRATDTEFNSHAWQLPWALSTFLDRRGHWSDWAAAQTSALIAAGRGADLLGQAHAHRDLAGACIQLGRYADADSHCLLALQLFTQLGDHAGQAHSHLSRGWMFGAQNRHRESLREAQQALTLFRAVGDRAGHAGALNNVGWCHDELGNHSEALVACQQALELFQGTGDRYGEANTWDSLGGIHHHLGSHPRARACYDNALKLYRAIGERYYEATVLTHLGENHHATGDTHSARTAWRTAFDILNQLEHADADDLDAKLRDLDHPAL